MLQRVRTRLRLEVEPPIPRALYEAARRTPVDVTPVADKPSSEDRGGARPRDVGSGRPLGRAMRLADRRLREDGKAVFDFGAEGNCGTLSFAGVCKHAGFFDLSGPQVRWMTVNHAAALLGSEAEWAPADRHGPALSVRRMLELALTSWAPKGLRVSAERWLHMMAMNGTWVDHAFLALAADCLRVRLNLYVTKNEGGIQNVVTFEPHPRTMEPDSVGTVEMVLELGALFCGVLPVDATDADQKTRPKCPTPMAPIEVQNSRGDLTQHEALVMTTSQLEALLEESRNLADMRREAVLTAEEFEAIAHALAESGEEMTSWVALAMQLSRESATREEEAALRLGLRLSEESHARERKVSARLEQKALDLGLRLSKSSQVKERAEEPKGDDDFLSYKETEALNPLGASCRTRSHMRHSLRGCMLTPRQYSMALRKPSPEVRGQETAV
ncbi:hypothetical protein OAO87_01455 [bacterium]|nr:hypothetical protein [bacterium]